MKELLSDDIFHFHVCVQAKLQVSGLLIYAVSGLVSLHYLFSYLQHCLDFCELMLILTYWYLKMLILYSVF